MVKIFADSSRAVLRFIRESDSTWGTTPASGNTRVIRFTGSTINAQKGTTTSDEILPDRMISDVIETDLKTSGDINVEFSAGAQDDFLEGFSYGFWTRPMTMDQVKGSSVAWTGNNTIAITSSIDYSSIFVAGHRIRTRGFLNAVNNDYFNIASVAFSSGVTTITVSTTTSIVEAGSINTAVYDANDVIVLKNTTIRSGTSGASAFDSNSNNAFAAAISAGQLVVGQKIQVDGLGYETGSVAFASGTVSSGTTVTISDGVTTQVFQFGGTLAAGAVAVANGGSNTASATNLAAAINALCAAGTLNVSAKVSTGTVSLKDLNMTGGSIAKAGDSGTLITVTAFSGLNATASGIFTITSVASDVIGVSPSPPTIANTTVPVTIKGSMLRNPGGTQTITPHSYSIETGFGDVGQYFVVSGQRCGTFSYDIAANAVVKGSFGFQGAAMTRSTSTVLGSGSYTPQNALTTNIMNATVDVGTILINGGAVSTAIQSIQIKGTNNLRDQMAVSNKFPAGIGAGRIELTGSLMAYFADGSNWDKFINHNTVSISFPLFDADSNTYQWTLPAVVFDTDTVNPAGRDQDIMENLSFTAKKDPNTLCVFQLDRISCTLPVASF